MEAWLPLIFMLLMAIAMLAYVVLDGYDLGVGILMHQAQPEQQDIMLASIGPFWDANETWLVLAVGILLVAFPVAHGLILGELYLPVAMMLAGLILRGVAFDFRVKVAAVSKPKWNLAFHVGSLLAALSQGIMLGLYIMGFKHGLASYAFALFIGLSLAAGYSLLGAGWLIMKCEGALQLRAVAWARLMLWLTAGGILAVSLATPLLSERIFERWFGADNLLWLAPIPLATAALWLIAERMLRTLPRPKDAFAWVPFACAVGMFMLAFLGLAYSLYPYIVIDRLTIWEAASAPESLKIILVGAMVTLPIILGYSIYAYRVFWGKATELRYDAGPG